MILSLFVMMMASPASSSSRCAITNTMACDDTNRLVWAKGFRAAITRFLGRSAHQRIDYIDSDQLVSQIEDVLGGPPDDRRSLADGGTLFTACRAHSCTEKGAIAFDAMGRIVAAAIVSDRCIDGGNACRGPTLDIYVRDRAASATARTAIADWARAATDADSEIIHRAPLAGPVVHVVR